MKTDPRVPPKPAQSECRRCQRLFCYFRTTCTRIYCAPCVELERLESLQFSKVQRRKQAASRAHRDGSLRHFAHFPDGGLTLAGAQA